MPKTDTSYNPPPRHQHDVLIIGGGAAGLSLALRLAPQCTVAIISKGSVHNGSTYYAQGGISSVISPNDTFESHIADTINAGAGLCDEDVVKFTVEHGPENIGWLQTLGVPFSPDIKADGERALHLTREGGHSHRRVIHAADATGREMSNTLETNARHEESITVQCY